MSTTLRATVTANVSVSLDNAAALSRGSESVSQLVQMLLTNGTGDNKAQRVYTQALTVLPDTMTLNLRTFDGAKDPFGNSYALSSVRLLWIQNTTSDPINLAPSVSNGWTEIFETGLVNITASGLLLLTAPLGSGFPVASNNYSLDINGGTETGLINIVVIGS